MKASAVLCPTLAPNEYGEHRCVIIDWNKKLGCLSNDQMDGYVSHLVRGRISVAEINHLLSLINNVI